jgi:predicted membrane protein
MNNENKVRNRSNNRALAGVILVIVGIGLLLRNLDVPAVPQWLFTWPMIIIIVGIYSGIKHNFRNNSWLFLIGFGTYFLVDANYPSLHLEPLFWPVMIIAMGVLFILRPRGRCRDNDVAYINQDNTSTDTGSKIESANVPWERVSDTSDFFKISSVFSGVKRTILSKDFKGGSISCVFGGAEIDLTQADINGKVVIRIEQVFGGAKIMVPPTWIVQNEIDGVFHGVEDKRNYNAAATINPDKILILKGTCVFAGIEVRSY